MDTLLLDMAGHKKEASLNKAAEIIRQGGTVAFPTETVYGLGADALNEEAVRKIYKAKGRPSDNPLIVHVSDAAALKLLTDDVSALNQKLMDVFWPGPLTLLFKKKVQVPEVITGGLATVAVRMPENEIALSLIQKAGVPIVGPSANLSGKPSPTKAEHVIDDLAGRVDAIILGGDCPVGLESTVMDALSAPPVILRPGGTSKEQIEALIGKTIINSDLKDGGQNIPKAPGMKYTHYAPKAPVIIFKGNLLNMTQKINSIKEEKEKEGLKVGILATDETADAYQGCSVYSVGSRKQIKSVAGNLFHVLRCFDREDIDIILAESFSTEGMGLAVMNRMLKSAGYHVIDTGGENV